MTQTATIERPTRAGVYTTVTEAEEIVGRLLAAGFSVDQITVICSDDVKERHFRAFEHEDPAGRNTPVAASIGGAIGATVGGLAVTTAGVATGNMPLALSGGAAGVFTGGILGGFLGAMMTRGIEKEAADFYDQAVVDGNILVAVEVHGDGAEESLARAERILGEAGAKPVPLSEG